MMPSTAAGGDEDAGGRSSGPATLAAACALALLLLDAAVAAAASAAAHGSSIPVAAAAASDLLREDDFVVAMGCSTGRLILAQASRAWRGHARCFVALNGSAEAAALDARHSSSGELYGFYPDDNTPTPADAQVVAPTPGGSVPDAAAAAGGSSSSSGGGGKPTPRSRGAADLRAALAPFLAHRRLGATYSWMLYSDDE